MYWLTVYKHCLLTLKPNAEETAEKNKKRVLQMCLRIPFYIHFRSGRLHFVKMVSKSLYHSEGVFILSEKSTPGFDND
jgi:hypothetical protein